MKKKKKSKEDRSNLVVIKQWVSIEKDSETKESIESTRHTSFRNNSVTGYESEIIFSKY